VKRIRPEMLYPSVRLITLNYKRNEVQNTPKDLAKERKPERLLLNTTSSRPVHGTRRSRHVNVLLYGNVLIFMIVLALLKETQLQRDSTGTLQTRRPKR